MTEKKQIETIIHYVSTAHPDKEIAELNEYLRDGWQILSVNLSTTGGEYLIYTLVKYED